MPRYTKPHIIALPSPAGSIETSPDRLRPINFEMLFISFLDGKWAEQTDYEPISWKIAEAAFPDELHVAIKIARPEPPADPVAEALARGRGSRRKKAA